MANIYINQFYCSTDTEANYLRILDWLYDNFEVHNLDGDKHWMYGEFSSKGMPGKTFEELTKELATDETLYIRIISFEPCGLNLDANVYSNGWWGQF